MKLTSGFKVYPPERGGKGKTPQGWLEGKVQADGAWPYWRIHDKLYDLTSFAEKHPGGKFWIETTRGSDITESFESSHFGSHPNDILNKYFVKEASSPRNSPFTFKENGFFMTLKRKVTPILLERGQGPTLESYFIQDGLLVTFLVLMIAGGYTHSVTLLVMAGLALGMCTVSSHNYIHQKTTWRSYICEVLLGLTSSDWRVGHTLSHHNYPNTIYDLEVTEKEPYLLLSRKLQTSRFKALAALGGFLIILSFPFVGAFKRLMAPWEYRWNYLISGGQAFLLILASKSLITGLSYWCLLQCVGLLYAYTIGATVSHYHPDVYSEGDNLPDQERDWGLFQIFASRNRVFLYNANFFSAISFGDHILHHLFPTVDMCKLPLLVGPFEETCREFGITNTDKSSWDLFKGTCLTAITSTENENMPNVIQKHHIVK